MKALLAGLLLGCVGLGGCRKTGFPDVPAGYREFAYVANAGSNTVTVLDLVYVREDRTLAVGERPVRLAVNPVRDEVYVLSRGNGAGSVAVIDTRANAVVATVPVHREPGSLVVDGAGKRLFVASAGAVAVVDLGTRRVVETVAMGGHGGELAVSPDGRTLAMTEPAGVVLFGVARVGASGRVLTERARFAGCAGATSPVILPDSAKVFVACPERNQVMAVGLAQAPDSWAVKQDAGAAADHVLALLDVGQRPMHLTLKPDGGEIFVSNETSDTVSEISTQTNEVGSTYAIGNRPAQGVVSGDDSALWVSNAGADTISLYSIDDGRFLSSLRTGEGPGALAFSADQHLLLAADRRSGDVAVIRTVSKLGPALFTILPAGREPVDVVVKAMWAK